MLANDHQHFCGVLGSELEDGPHSVPSESLNIIPQCLKNVRSSGRSSREKLAINVGFLRSLSEWPPSGQNTSCSPASRYILLKFADPPTGPRLPIAIFLVSRSRRGQRSPLRIISDSRYRFRMRSGDRSLEPLRPDLNPGKRNMVSGSPTLDGLPCDVLCLVRDCVAETDLCQHTISASRLEESSAVDWRAYYGQRHPLGALSRVSRSIRAVCCPVMFSRIKLSEAILPPRAILSYTCMLWITLCDLDNLRFDYHGMLRSMTRLRTIFWQPSEASELPECNVKFALSSPTLTTFMTRKFQFRGVMSPLTATSLQALDVSQGWRDLTKVTVGEIAAEMQFLESLIAQLVPQLQLLRIPGESCRLSFLAATAWPHLRELVIWGGAPKTDVPFYRLFSVMLRLRILALAI